MHQQASLVTLARPVPLTEITRLALVSPDVQPARITSIVAAALLDPLGRNSISSAADEMEMPVLLICVVRMTVPPTSTSHPCAQSADALHTGLAEFASALHTLTVFPRRTASERANARDAMSSLLTVTRRVLRVSP